MTWRCRRLTWHNALAEVRPLPVRPHLVRVTVREKKQSAVALEIPLIPQRNLPPICLHPKGLTPCLYPNGPHFIKSREHLTSTGISASRAASPLLKPCTQVRPDLRQNAFLARLRPRWISKFLQVQQDRRAWHILKLRFELQCPATLWPHRVGARLSARSGRWPVPHASHL